MKKKLYIKPTLNIISLENSERLMEGGSVHGEGNYPMGIGNDGESGEDDEAFSKQFTYDPSWSDFDFEQWY